MNSKIIKLSPPTYDFDVNNFSHINNTRNDVILVSLLENLSEFHLCFFWL